MQTALVIQHAANEGLGSLGTFLEYKRVALQLVHPYAHEPVPRDAHVANLLILMGGPLSVYEMGRYPFLKKEMTLIEQFLKAGKPVLGICLGAQLLAETLGGRVHKSVRKEIGWYPVTLTDEGEHSVIFRRLNRRTFHAFHWHGDTFHLPAGATHLARSEAFSQQSFCYGDRNYGLQFHVEITAEMIQNWLTAHAREVQEAIPLISKNEILQDTATHIAPLNGFAEIIYRGWFEALTLAPATFSHAR